MNCEARVSEGVWECYPTLAIQGCPRGEATEDCQTHSRFLWGGTTAPSGGKDRLPPRGSERVNHVNPSGLCPFRFAAQFFQGQHFFPKTSVAFRVLTFDCPRAVIDSTREKATGDCSKVASSPTWRGSLK
ncbi:hypothetical protein RRG08_057356 [Elysia crispata]|uniref:Uncharacterized protein n=1 Tax=Elysia crispata TaxID=231223 RepID=A0AAE0YJ39_9GAST|nr:hypothetical protein RRG08_057356 [Elysia crispata]